MFGSQVLDTGIGLAMLFAFMSLIATSLNEALETLLKARAKQLEQGIRNILGDPDGTSALAKAFYNSPFITILYSGEYKDNIKKDSLVGFTKVATDSAKDNSMPIRSRGNLPSYIPAANFALAVLHMAGEGTTSAAAINNGLGKSLTSLKVSSPDLPVPTLQPPADAGNAATGKPVAKLTNQNAEKPLNETDLGKLVSHAMALASDDVAIAQKHLEDWYDSSMDRVSGWYKQRTQKILFCLGLFAAVALNVDTIQIGRALMAQPAMRQAIIAKASAANASSAGSPFDPIVELKGLDLPIGWSKPPQFDGLCQDYASCWGAADSARRWTLVPAVGSAIFGWLVTAFAVMLGAPFWFDLLNKFMQLRTSLKPQEPGDGDKKAETVKLEVAQAPVLPKQ
jgi:hypothetical protein